MNPDLPDDFEETVIETFYEIETEEQITMILAELLDDVVQAIEDFEITRHFVKSPCPPTTWNVSGAWHWTLCIDNYSVWRYMMHHTSD